MTDDTDNTATPGTLKRAANRFHLRKNTPYELSFFHWPFVLLHEAGFRNWKGLANLYINLLSLAWDHGTLTDQNLPKITLHLKPLRETLDVPTRTFQNQLKQLETLGVIKRKRISGDRLNGNRTRIIVWAPKFTLEFLRENAQNGNEIKIGFPFFGVPDRDFGVPDRASTGTPGHTTTTRRSCRDNSTEVRSTRRAGVPDRKKRLKQIAARKKRSDGSGRKTQTKKPVRKHTQAGLVAWYRNEIRKQHGHNPTVNPFALRTKKWKPEKWKLVYQVLPVVIKQWDDFLGAQKKHMESPPAYMPLEWINSWWNAFYGWYKVQQDTTSDVLKPPKRLTSGFRKLPV
jgi:hypothetical protein